MAYETHWESRGVCQHYYGAVTGAERVAGTNAILGDQRFDDLRYIIVDYTGTTSLDFEQSDLEYVFATNLGALLDRPRVKIALVIDGPVVGPAHERMKRLAELPRRLKVVGSIEEARRWLTD